MDGNFTTYKQKCWILYINGASDPIKIKTYLTNYFLLQGNIGSSNWGLNLLQEENVIPDIMMLAQHCEVLSVRGYVYLIIKQNLKMIVPVGFQMPVLYSQGYIFCHWFGNQLLRIIDDSVWEDSQNCLGSSKVQANKICGGGNYITFCLL